MESINDTNNTLDEFIKEIKKILESEGANNESYSPVLRRKFALQIIPCVFWAYCSLDINNNILNRYRIEINYNDFFCNTKKMLTRLLTFFSEINENIKLYGSNISEDYLCRLHEYCITIINQAGLDPDLKGIWIFVNSFLKGNIKKDIEYKNKPQIKCDIYIDTGSQENLSKNSQIFIIGKFAEILIDFEGYNGLIEEEILEDILFVQLRLHSESILIYCLPEVSKSSKMPKYINNRRTRIEPIRVIRDRIISCIHDDIIEEIIKNNNEKPSWFTHCIKQKDHPINQENFFECKFPCIIIQSDFNSENIQNHISIWNVFVFAWQNNSDNSESIVESVKKLIINYTYQEIPEFIQRAKKKHILKNKGQDDWLLYWYNPLTTPEKLKPPTKKLNYFETPEMA